MRLLIAALLGGIAMFAWGAFSHMVLNIEATTLKPMPNEAAVAAAMKSNLSDPGIYFLPGMDMTKPPSAEEQAAWTAKYKEGPTAMLIYNPTGADVMTPRQFGTQFGTDFGAALVGAIILMLASVSFMRGVVISALVGLAAWVSISIPYWNWFRFPSEFIRGELIDQVAGWFLAGLIMAFILRRRT